MFAEGAQFAGVCAADAAGSRNMTDKESIVTTRITPPFVCQLSFSEIAPESNKNGKKISHKRHKRKIKVRGSSLRFLCNKVVISCHFLFFDKIF